MVHARHIGPLLGNHRAYFDKLSRLIIEFKVKCTETPTLGKSAINHTVQDSHINVSATDNTHGFLAFHGHFVEHYGCNARCTRALCHHFLTLDEFQNGCTNLVFRDGNNLIYIFGTGVKGQLSRLFYSDAVGYSRYTRQTFYLVIMNAVDHTWSAFCLYSVDFHMRIKALNGIGNA